jgi:hypothetical protein
MPYGPFSPTVGAAAFWLFIAACGLASILSPWLRQREVHRTMRTMIESGKVVDSETITAMTGGLEGPPVDQKQRLREQMLGGVMAMAAGFGIGVVGLCISMMAHRQIYVIYGGAVLVVLVGAALFGYSRLALNDRNRWDTGSDR